VTIQFQVVVGRCFSDVLITIIQLVKCVGLSAPTPQRVAFFVGLSENIGPVKEHTGIVFDRVVTNIGNAYDAQSGRFTSPVNATYQFNVVISAQGRQKVTRGVNCICNSDC